MSRLPLLALLALAPLGLAPAAHAASESCDVSAWTWNASVTCAGLLYESATLTWCPNDPTVDCLNEPLLHCVAGTTRPFLLCSRA